MKKKIVIAAVLLIVLAIVLFPVSTVRSISGNAEVLTLQKEKIGTCELAIEIKEVSSLLLCYQKSFSFVLDGNAVEAFETTSSSEADEICLLSQMYYDEETDSMSMCSLLYKKDLSYVVLYLGSNYYFINNGADISYQDLPLYS